MIEIGELKIPTIPRTSAHPCVKCGEPLYVHSADGGCPRDDCQDAFAWDGEYVFVVPVDTCCGELPGEEHRYDLHPETGCGRG